MWPLWYRPHYHYHFTGKNIIISINRGIIIIVWTWHQWYININKQTNKYGREKEKGENLLLKNECDVIWISMIYKAKQMKMMIIMMYIRCGVWMILFRFSFFWLFFRSPYGYHRIVLFGCFGRKKQRFAGLSL